MDLELAGKRALVTGATGGIGEAVAKMLAAEGARVIVNGRTAAKADRVAAEIMAAGGEAVVAVGDVETDAGLAQTVAAVRASLGGVDILINNVGGRVTEGMVPFGELTLDEWMAGYRKNVVAAVALINAFVEDMKAAGWGRIINVATIAAVEPNVAPAEYQASKAALINLTKSLSHVLAHTGVTANIVSPGVVLTPTVRDWISDLARIHGWEGTFDDHQRRYTREIRPLDVDGVGDPEDVAYVIVTLASPRSRYVTGANYRADGGSLRSI